MAERKRKFWWPFHEEDSDSVGWIDHTGSHVSDDEPLGPHHHPNHNNPATDKKNKTNPNSGSKKPKGGLFR